MPPSQNQVINPQEFFQTLVSHSFFDHPIKNIEVCESNCAFVFLTGPYAYKMRKPIRLEGLVDYATPDKRGFYLSKELELNRVWGHDIYQGLLPVYADTKGGYCRQAHGKAMEYLLKMKQMPKEALLSDYLEKGDLLSGGEVQTLARQLASFQEKVPRDAAFSYPNLLEHCRFVTDYLSQNGVYGEMQPLIDKLYSLLDQCAPILEKRAASGFRRDGHGDFRASNIFFFEQKFYPFDRLEFSDDLRMQDVATDVAPLLVDFYYFGQDKAVHIFLEEYRSQPVGKGIEEVLPFHLLFWVFVHLFVKTSLIHQNQGSKVAAKYRKELEAFFRLGQKLAR